jgi:ppGpp synthetase/RelA/SpoT-type nucleotidyltranferase/regulator of sirC expression with transglutaminase-like and TPR domain
MSKITVSIPHKNEIKEIYESYNPVLSSIMQKIEAKLKSTIKLASMPTYKSRIKSFNSYYRKVLRLKAEEVARRGQLVELTDMMGIRVICAFMEDLKEVERQVRESFTVREVEYKGSGDNFREFGYESIHVLISIPEDCMPENPGIEIPKDMVCEIQIRTILQDAWAEVEHELIYKTEFTPFDMPLRRKLASINASLSLADTIFQEIRDYQKKLQMETAARRESFYEKVDDATSEFSEEERAKKQNIARISPFVRGTIDDLLLEAIHAHNSGEMEKAVSIYTQILESTPVPPAPVLSVVHKHRGMAYFASNEYDAALNDFDLSVQYDPNGFRSFYYKGIVYSVKEDYQHAIEAFNKSLEINEFQSHARYRRAVAYSKVGEDSKALEDLNAAEAMGLNDADCKLLKEKLLKKLDISM